MPKAELGTKRSCPKCSKRFYDLNKDPATCPECGNVFEIQSLYQSDMRERAKADKKVKDDDFEIVDADDILEDTGDVDDDLLEDDDDNTVSFEELGDVAAPDDDK